MYVAWKLLLFGVGAILGVNAAGKNILLWRTSLLN
nr:MAG TPA: AAA domain protein [Caudoviricetes sp.]